MSLTNDEKKVLAQLHLDKAHACLKDGEQLPRQRFFLPKSTI